MGLIEKKESERVEDIKKDLLDVIDSLADYKDSGLTSDQVMELSEAVGKLERYFEDKITVNQVIDFFVDFYVAQGDPERPEEALLLTNKSVAKYRELKERDTARAPEPAPLGIDGMVCPSCGKKALPWDRFCGECGQRILRRNKDAETGTSVQRAAL